MWGRMKDPVSGVFVKVSEYFPHPGSSSMQVRLTGYIEADGIPHATVEVRRRVGRDDTSGRLPVLVDRAEPSRFRVQWNQVPKFDGGAASARQAAADSAPDS